MTITNQDVKIYKGDSATLPIAVTAADGSQFDPTLDLQVQWRLARTWYSDTLVLKKLDQGIELTPTGVTVTLAPEDTDLPPGVYYHELKVWEGTDRSTTLVGAAIIKPSMPMTKDLASVNLQTHAPTVSLA